MKYLKNSPRIRVVHQLFVTEHDTEHIALYDFSPTHDSRMTRQPVTNAFAVAVAVPKTTSQTRRKEYMGEET